MCETILRPSLPDGDAPFVATLRPLFVDNDLMLLREMSRPKGREVLMLVLSRATAARGEATALAATKQQQQHSRQPSRHQHRKSHLASIATSGSQLRRRRGEPRRRGGRLLSVRRQPSG